MDDEFRRLEELLKGLPVRRPPASLDAKVLRPARRRALGLGVTAAAAAAAAAALAALLLWPRTPHEPPSVGVSQARRPGQLEPMQVEETVSQLSYQGLVAPDESWPMRVLRRRAITRTWLVDPQTGYTVETTVPHDQILLIRAEIY